MSTNSVILSAFKTCLSLSVVLISLIYYTLLVSKDESIVGIITPFSFISTKGDVYVISLILFYSGVLVIIFILLFSLPLLGHITLVYKILVSTKDDLAPFKYAFNDVDISFIAVSKLS
jgi:hypothetical protein